MIKSSQIKKLLVAVTIALILTIGVRWLYGVSPYGQFMKLIYNDIPVQVVEVKLAEGASSTIRTRIIRRNIYDLNLLVYFNNDEERSRVDELIGGPVGQSGNKARRPGTRTHVHIVVRDAGGKVIRDQTVQAEGRVATGSAYLGRRLDTFELSEGVYEINVTFLDDASRLSELRTALQVYYLFN